jgi:hypothetical protein
MNCLHKKKSFNANIIRFDGLNQYQRHVYLSTTRICDLSSLNQELKNNKNKFLYQN